MKTYLTYGAGLSLASFLLTLVLFFAGLFDEAGKLGTAQMIQGIAGVGLAVAAYILGARAKRNLTPTDEPFGYGRAFGATMMIVLIAAVVGTILQYLFMTVINPGFMDTVLEAQVAKAVEKGANEDQVRQAMQMWMKPGINAAFGFIGSLFFGTIIGLITSIFCRRKESDITPPAIPAA